MMSIYQDSHEMFTTQGKKPGKQSADSAERTKEGIILAALRIFAQQGYDVGLREIALEAGVTHGLIRHYFGSKEGVWRAVADFAVRQFEIALNPSFQQIARSQTPPVELLKSSIRSFLGVCARYPQMIQLMLHEGIEGGPRFEYVIGRLERIDDAMAPLLIQIQQQGYLQQFDSRTFFLYLLTAGAAPFGLRAMSQRLLKADILSEEQAQLHLNRLLDTLFAVQE